MEKLEGSLDIFSWSFQSCHAIAYTENGCIAHQSISQSVPATRSQGSSWENRPSTKSSFAVKEIES